MKYVFQEKTEDLNLSLFNMISEINESKTLTKHISCKCKCNFEGRKSNSDQKRNDNKCFCEYKNHHLCEKSYIWNSATSSCKNGKYLWSIICNSVIACVDEILDAGE